MGKRLYVGSLPFSTTEQELNALFTPLGQVTSSRLIIDKMTGQSKGFGFVEMASDSEAQAAIDQLNNSTVGTRRIIVNEARPMEPRTAGAFAGRASGNGAGFKR